MVRLGPYLSQTLSNTLHVIVIRNLVGRLFVQKQPHPAGDGAPLASNGAPSANGGAPVTSGGACLAGDGAPQRNTLVL